MFDEEPDGDPHGECALEIKTLQARIAELTEAAAAASGQCMGADFERALIQLVMTECAGICDKYSEEQWSAFKKAPINDPRRGNPYVEGTSDGAETCAFNIRNAAKDLK